MTKELVAAHPRRSETIDFSTNAADGLNGGMILLTQGQLSITDSVTINATMLSAGLTINAGGGT